jgi:hypothetical protein
MKVIIDLGCCSTAYFQKSQGAKMDVSVFLYVEGLLFIWFWCVFFFFYWIPFEKLSQKDIFVFLCNLLCFSSNFNAILLLFLQKNRLYQLLMGNENVLAIFFFFKISTIIHIWKVYRIFDFHPILMHFFSLDWFVESLLYYVKGFPLSLMVSD